MQSVWNTVQTLCEILCKHCAYQEPCKDTVHVIVSVRNPTKTSCASGILPTLCLSLWASGILLDHCVETLCMSEILQKHCARQESYRDTLRVRNPVESLCAFGILQRHCACQKSCKDIVPQESCQITVQRHYTCQESCRDTVQRHCAHQEFCRGTVRDRNLVGSLCMSGIL